MLNNTSASLSRMAKLSGLGIVALFLAGCAFAPGGHIKSVEETTQDSLEGEVRTRAITPQLLAELEQPEATPEFNNQLEEARGDYDYIVGKGDVLMITVWNHPELTIPAGSMRDPADAGNWVHSDGTIFYPYVGKVEVAGKSVTEIRELLAERLSGYIEAPQVDVTVAAFRSKRVYVTGEVNQPGTFPVTNVPMTLLDAVSSAGGINEFADWRNVTLTRDGKEQSFSLQDLYQRGDTRQNILLQPGDVVHVERNDANKVFVLGEVNEPQSVMFNRSGMTLAEALAESGGWKENSANASGVFVLRRAPENAEHLIDVFQLNAKNAAALVFADQFRLQERDVVYVTSAPVSRWNRIVTQILPTAQVLYFSTLTEDNLTRSGN